MSLRFEDRPPPQVAVTRLYESVGWTGYTRDHARLLRGLAASTYVTSAWDEDECVGLARAISDEATVWFLQDLLVLRERQRQGIGRALLERCEERFADVSRGVLLTEGAAVDFYLATGWTKAEAHDLVSFLKLTET